jgi:hypothetical protein
VRTGAAIVDGLAELGVTAAFGLMGEDTAELITDLLPERRTLVSDGGHCLGFPAMHVHADEPPASPVLLDCKLVPELRAHWMEEPV